MSAELVPALESGRRAEKAQALFYRALAAAAIDRDDAGLTQRFQELHADEQHHLSRLTARLIELGVSPADLSGVRAPDADLGRWEPAAAAREAEEVRFYESLLLAPLDEHTRALVEEILGVERSHAAELGGKWTMA